MSDLLYADDLVLRGESKEDLKVMVGSFVEVCGRKGLKVNTDKSRMTRVGGEKESGCEVRVNMERLEQVPEFKYLRCVLNESSTDDAECRRKVASGRKFEGAIRSFVNTRGLQLECARVLQEGLLVPTLLYARETMIWR